jgi:hypothetical protein
MELATDFLNLYFRKFLIMLPRISKKTMLSLPILKKE